MGGRGERTTVVDSCLTFVFLPFPLRLRLRRVIHKIVSPLLSKKTQEKVRILRSHAELLQFFTPDQLLPMHGGTSAFKFPHKKPARRPEDEDDSDDEDEDALDTSDGLVSVKTVDVSAGKTHVVEEETDPSLETVYTWHFKPVSRSIGFAVHWIPLSGGPGAADAASPASPPVSPATPATPPATPVDVAAVDVAAASGEDGDGKSASASGATSPPAEYLEAQEVVPLRLYNNKRAIKGSFAVKGRGVCRFVFSNEHSWWFSKTVTFLVQSSGVMSAASGASAAAAGGAAGGAAAGASDAGGIVLDKDAVAMEAAATESGE